MNDEYQHRLSAAINWLRFPLIFFIIILHSYSVVHIDGPAASVYFKTVYPFALWIGETGVPGFFFISGFLFFLSKKAYQSKITSRLQSLFIPYVLWNSILLILYLIAYALGHPQDINGKSITSYQAFDYLRLYWDRGSFDNGNFTPLLCPFWYIRNLLLMCLLSPLFYYLIKYGRELFLSIVLAWWLITNDNAFIPQTILFFCLGSYFSILKLNVLRIITHNKKTFCAIFLGLACCDILSHTFFPTPINLQLHRLALIANIPVLLLIADYFSRKGLSSSFLTNASFFTFALHYPIVIALRKASIQQFAEASAFVHILLYFACIIMTIIICIALCYLFDKYFPRAKRILSGNR